MSRSLLPAGADCASWNAQITAAMNHYSEDRKEEAVRAVVALVNSRNIPMYHRIQALCLLSIAVDDPARKVMHQRIALDHWRTAREWHPQGQDAAIDGHMATLLDLLEDAENKLDKALVEEYDRRAREEAELFGFD